MPEDLDDREHLLELLEYRMPFGKYQGCRLLELPEAYLAWFARKGMPAGKLGRLMATALVVRANGLDQMCQRLRSDVSRTVPMQGEVANHPERMDGMRTVRSR